MRICLRIILNQNYHLAKADRQIDSARGGSTWCLIMSPKLD